MRWLALVASLLLVAGAALADHWPSGAEGWPGTAWPGEQWVGAPFASIPEAGLVFALDFDGSGCTDPFHPAFDGMASVQGVAGPPNNEDPNACDYSGEHMVEGVNSGFLQGKTLAYTSEGRISARDAFAITSGQATMDFMFKVVRYSAANPAVVRLLDGGAVFKCLVVITHSGGVPFAFRLIGSNGSTLTTGTVPWNEGEWYKMRLTYDTGIDRCELFVDQIDDPVGSGNFENIAVTAGVAADHDVRGLDLLANNQSDLVFDQVSVCGGLLPVGVPCDEHPPIEMVYSHSFEATGTTCNNAAEDTTSTHWSEVATTSGGSGDDCDCDAVADAANCPLLGGESMRLGNDVDGDNIHFNSRFTESISGEFTADFLFRPVDDGADENAGLVSTVSSKVSTTNTGFRVRTNFQNGVGVDMDILCGTGESGSNTTVAFSTNHQLRVQGDTTLDQYTLFIDPVGGTIGAGATATSTCDGTDAAAAIDGLDFNIRQNGGLAVFDDVNVCRGLLPSGQRCRQQTFGDNVAATP